MALYGIYGRHEINMCPWNNIETAKRAIEIANSDLSKIRQLVCSKVRTYLRQTEQNCCF